MAERPILFSGPLVRAILAGRKTETRRLVTPYPTRQPHRSGDARTGHRSHWAWDCKAVRHFIYPEIEPEVMAGNCPLGMPGDMLWVRESWRAPIESEKTKPSGLVPGSPVMFEADRHVLPAHGAHAFGKGRPSIFMPRWASRISLRVVDVRAERLQEITNDGAIAEGLARRPMLEQIQCYPTGTAERRAFQDLWDQINGKREGATWSADPWVWRIKFEVAEVRR